MARILHGKFDAQFLVPIRVEFEFSFTDPLGIIFDDTFNFEVVRNFEFIQSDPDREEFVPSLGIEPDRTLEILHHAGLYADIFFPFLQIGTEQAVILRRPTLAAIGPIGPH